MPKYDIGKYEVEITNQGFQKASTGNVQFVLQFRVLGRVDPNDPNTLLNVERGERKYYKAITENTVDWLMEDLKALGAEGFTSWGQLDPTIAPDGFIDLRGRKAEMMCGSKVGKDGNSYEDWSLARENTAKPIEAAEKKDVQALDRLFGKQLKQKASPRPSAPAMARSAPAARTMTDDEVPF